MSGSVPFRIYVKYSLMTLVSMMLGSQIVHNYYRPLDDLEDYVDKEIENLKNDSKS